MSEVREETGLVGDEVQINITLTLVGVPENVSTQIKDEMLEEAKELLARRADEVLSRYNIDMHTRQV